MNNLCDLAKVYEGTDKENCHSYFSRVYEEILFPHKKEFTKICEIGIGIREAHSLRIWKDYFENSKIALGLDISFPSSQISEGVFVENFDQSNKQMILDKSKELFDFDLIVDDGSHTMHDQQITLCYFINSLKLKGIYILEDLHTSLYVKGELDCQVYYGDKNETTTLDMLKNFSQTGNFSSSILSKEECSNLENNIEKVIVFDEIPSSITSVIYKK